jgi:hypothetical protein
MLEYVFTQPEVAEVVATADLNNRPSIRVLEKGSLTSQSQDESQTIYLVRSPRGSGRRR